MKDGCGGNPGDRQRGRGGLVHFGSDASDDLSTATLANLVQTVV